MIQTMSHEFVRFMRSRFGELKISKARYEDLLSETQWLLFKIPQTPTHDRLILKLKLTMPQ
jgi:hypothetical protein